MDDDFITNRDLSDLIADSPNDARAVAAAGVKILWLTLLLTFGDNVNRITEGRSNVVVVDPRGHDVDEYILRPHSGCRYHLTLPRFIGFAKAVLADNKGVHLFGNDS